jgi:hypothetical protein
MGSCMGYVRIWKDLIGRYDCGSSNEKALFRKGNSATKRQKRHSNLFETESTSPTINKRREKVSTKAKLTTMALIPSKHNKYPTVRAS